MSREANRAISSAVYAKLTGLIPPSNWTNETINAAIEAKMNTTNEEAERNYLSLVIESVNTLPHTLDFLTSRKMQNMYNRFLGEINETICKYQTYLTDHDNF